jgi:hypothetical protein
MRVFQLYEASSALYTATIVDEAGVPVPAAALATLTLTLYNADVAEPVSPAANIINSRSAQNVLNQNGVTVDSQGLLSWTIATADTPIVDSMKATELHVALWIFTYGTPTKTGRHRTGLRVVNFRKV